MPLLLRIGAGFEIELSIASVYIRVGAFERFYNRMGLPNGSYKD